jgi:hypothetical protein
MRAISLRNHFTEKIWKIITDQPFLLSEFFPAKIFPGILEKIREKIRWGKKVIPKITKKTNCKCTGVYQLLFWINFWGCPGNLKITVTPLWPRFESYHELFFPYTFFYSFYQILIRSWDVELHTKFQPHKFFFEGVIQYFPFLKIVWKFL